MAAASYFCEGHRWAEAYYTEDARVAVEVDRWWAGERDGSTVLAGRGDLVRWVEGVDLASGEVKGVIRSGGSDRLPLRFVEVVVNNPKSLSIVASQNPVVAAAVDEVLSRQADEIAKYLSVVAVTRSGARGAQVEVGGLRLETARVRHLTSREGDPHRHVHLLVNTRVRAPDGSWRGLHSAAVRQHIRAVNERGTRILVTDRNLREVLAGEGYTLGADGEVDQARAAVELLSKRSVLVAENRGRAEAVWRGLFPGREPSQRVRNGWDQQGWAEGRKTKPFEHETPEQMSERVRVELAEFGFDFTLGAHRRGGPDRAGLTIGKLGVSAEAVSVGPVVSVAGVDRDGLAVEVVAVLSGMKSAWTQADLAAQVEAAVAGCGVVGDPGAVGELVDDVAARAVGRCVSVLDPGVHTPTAMSRHLTSAQVVDADIRLNLGLAGLAGGDGGGGRDDVGYRLAVTEGLDGGQAGAVGAVCGTRRLEVIVGPAGTGKTRMLEVANRVVVGQGRDLRVFAPTRKAAMVAGAEVGAEGAALSKLLFEHGFRWDSLGRWVRLGEGEVDPGTGRVYGGPGVGWGLSGRSVVVVDEAGLVTVDQANALIDIAAESGAAVRLVGDPRQLGAVGRGGVMETASRWVDEGPVVLDQVHRFLTVTVDETGLPVTATDVDYAALSLLLRDGDRPERAVDRLVGRGAVVVHASERDAVAVIAEEVVAGGEAVTVTVATNDDVRAVNQAVRELRVAAGQVDDTYTAAGMDGARIGVGDRIVTRRNDTGRNVANRECWTVEAVTAEGTVVARGGGGRRVRLDAGYLAGHTQLAYAATDYGNQGVTIDRAVTWVGAATTAGGLYVGATRGRYENTVHVVADDLEAARAQLVAAAGRDRADRGLDVARVRAETDAVPIPAAGVGEPVGGVWVDPALWRTETELDAAAIHAAARLAEQLGTLVDVEVMPGKVREGLDRADRAAAGAARRQADSHQADINRIHYDRYRWADLAVADYTAAREDAQTVDAGPGRLRFRAGQVDAAVARREETARRWSEPNLPSAGWSDAQVRRAAGEAVERAVAAAVAPHRDAANRQTQTAAEHEARIVARDRDRRAAVSANQANAEQRRVAVAAAEKQQARIGHHRDDRAVQAATMTAAQIVDADRARHAYAAEQGRLRRLDTPTPTVGAGGSGRQAGPGPTRPDPAGWRTAEELARVARAVEAELAAGLRSLPPPQPVMADQERERQNRADRAAAAAAWERAAVNRDQVDRIQAARDRLVDTAVADYLAARDDARVIQAGPGRLGRKTGRVDAAAARRAETARRWTEQHQLPGPVWSDDAVRNAATTAAERTVAAAMGPYQAEVDREQHTAAALERRVTVRNNEQQSAMAANQRIASRRETLLEAAETGRGRIASSMENRAGRAETMTPEQLAAADHTRTAHNDRNIEQARQHQIAAQREQALQTRQQHQRRPRGPVIDRDGPGIEM